MYEPSHQSPTGMLRPGGTQERKHASAPRYPSTARTISLRIRLTTSPLSGFNTQLSQCSTDRPHPKPVRRHSIFGRNPAHKSRPQIAVPVSNKRYVTTTLMLHKPKSWRNTFAFGNPSARSSETSSTTSRDTGQGLQAYMLKANPGDRQERKSRRVQDT